MTKNLDLTEELVERLSALRKAAIDFADDVYQAGGGGSENAERVSRRLITELMLSEFAIAKAGVKS